METLLRFCDSSVLLSHAGAWEGDCKSIFNKLDNSQYFGYIYGQYDLNKEAFKR